MTSNPYRPAKVLSPETKARIKELEALRKEPMIYDADLEHYIQCRIKELKQ